MCNISELKFLGSLERFTWCKDKKLRSMDFLWDESESGSIEVDRG